MIPVSSCVKISCKVSNSGPQHPFLLGTACPRYTVPRPGLLGKTPWRTAISKTKASEGIGSSDLFCFKFATSCADCWYGLESSQRMMPISMKLINRYSIVTLFLKQTSTLGRLWCSANGYHYTSKSNDRIARKKIERNCDRWMPVQRIKTNGLWKAHLCTAEVPFDLIIFIVQDILHGGSTCKGCRVASNRQDSSKPLETSSKLPSSW